jgi:tetratricopeptide (TPR) repeat protein
VRRTKSQHIALRTSTSNSGLRTSDYYSSVSSPRIEELLRRVESDPAPFVFAQLAEEYRRAGRHAEAVRCCRDGLERHPGYLSARLILGRALAEMGSLDEATVELERVLQSAPDNLSATRDLAEIHLRQGHLEQALDYYERAVDLFRHDAELEGKVRELSRRLGKETLAADSRADRPVRPRVDFDNLLSTLGASDQPLPPVMEMLLARPASGGSMDSPLPGASSERLADDVIAKMEASGPVLVESDRRILAELEAWLAALRSRSGRAGVETS